ncbi:hypothetical protein NL676_014220 [Syzygium grande]|nr:hypothetical protein NL676_014220 [Syzygium grande]
MRGESSTVLARRRFRLISNSQAEAHGRYHEVYKYAASSKEEWVEQCKLWPTSYHPPTYNISGRTGFSEEDSRSVVSFMNYALELAKSHGNVVVNAAAIVDHLSNQVIARACDEVCSWHTPKTEVGAEFSSSTKTPADMTGWIKHELGLQRCSLGGPEQVETSISCLHPQWWVDERTCRSSSFWHPLQHAAIVAIESSAARDRCLLPDEILVDNGDKNDDARGNGDLSSRPYLCTGNDIYLVWEPCTMCAMALVHQRIRRVFYAFPNPSAGALGSVHWLRGQKSLNHHYAVFRVVMPQDILDKAKTSICGS